MLTTLDDCPLLLAEGFSLKENEFNGTHVKKRMQREDTEGHVTLSPNGLTSFCAFTMFKSRVLDIVRPPTSSYHYQDQVEDDDFKMYVGYRHTIYLTLCYHFTFHSFSQQTG